MKLFRHPPSPSQAIPAAQRRPFPRRAAGGWPGRLARAVSAGAASRAASILLPTLLAACAAAPVADASYPLQPGQRATLANGMSLTYDSFSDSRCPANTQCVWAGRLALRFILAGPDGQEEFSLGPDQPQAAPAALRGARITLDAAAIPPARIGARPAAAFPVTLTVSAK